MSETRVATRSAFTDNRLFVDRRSLRQRLLTRELVDRLTTVCSPLFLLAVWQIAAMVGRVDVRFFPAPSSILATFGEMVRSGGAAQLPGHVLGRIVVRGHDDDPGWAPGTEPRPHCCRL